jgi:hypothetical protein
MRRYGVALALVALLAGCSHDDHAGSLPSLSPSPSTTSVTPSPTDDVAAAARAYYAALEKAGQTGDATPLAALLAPSCDCRKQVDYIRREAAAGHHTTTTYAIENVRPHDVTASAAAATVTYSSPASKVLDASGRTVRTLSALSHVGYDLALRLDGGHWLVERIVRLT